jgi:hypothetical protein
MLRTLREERAAKRRALSARTAESVKRSIAISCGSRSETSGSTVIPQRLCGTTGDADVILRSGGIRIGLRRFWVIPRGLCGPTGDPQALLRFAPAASGLGYGGSRVITRGLCGPTGDPDSVLRFAPAASGLGYGGSRVIRAGCAVPPCRPLSGGPRSETSGSRVITRRLGGATGDPDTVLRFAPAASGLGYGGSSLRSGGIRMFGIGGK